jgi:hypothetical protein
MSSVLQDSAGNLRLKRTFAASIGFVMVWMSLAGGCTLLRAGDILGWVALVFGLMLLGLPFTGFFRRYWNTEVSTRALPAMILIANAALIFLYGWIAWIYLSDPFLTYNDLNTLAAVVFGVAAALSFLALVVNVIALRLDRRAR